MKFQARRLGLFDQMAVAKRLMPVMNGIMTEDLLKAVMAAKVNGEAFDRSKIDFMALIPAMTKAIHDVPDEDMERIVRTCLKVVQVWQTQVWADVMDRNGNIMFDTLNKNPSIALQIVWKVVEEHLTDFFSTAR